jgi:hypothetical protein
MNAQEPDELLPDCSSCAKHADLESLRRRHAVHDWQGHGYKNEKARRPMLAGGLV